MLAAGTFVLLSLTAGLSICYVVNKVMGSVIFRKRRKGEPKIVKGHLLWGSGEEFAQHAVNFLHEKKKEYGDVFTIRLANQYLTVIMDPHSVDAVARERNFDFDPIQKQVNNNVFAFALKDARKMIKDTGRTVRGAYLDKSMTAFVNHLSNACTRLSNSESIEDNWHEDGLRTFTSKTMFDAIFYTIFGAEHHPVFNPRTVYKNFEVFHHYFNLLWLGFPHYLFPEAGRCVGVLRQQPSSEELINRPDASDYLKTSIEFMKEQGQTDSDIQGHNLVYLHVNYNTFRLAFWCLVNILESSEARKALMDEINDAVEERIDEETNTAIFTLYDVENLKVLDSIIKESTRLSSGVFMVRYVTKDTWFTSEDSKKQYLIREGDRVAIYPPATHKDPEIFEDPLVFKYDRFIDNTFYKSGKELKHPLPAFGTLCPGKRFATLQLKWYLIQIMTSFEFVNKSDYKAELDTKYHGHEILPPVKDLQINFREKEGHPTLIWERE